MSPRASIVMDPAARAALARAFERQSTQARAVALVLGPVFARLAANAANVAKLWSSFERSKEGR